jgi:hypothetical protein
VRAPQDEVGDIFIPAKAGIQYSLTLVFTGSPAYAGDDETGR